MQVRFHAHKAAYSCSVAIDNILVEAEGSGVASVKPVEGAMVTALDGNVIVMGADAGEVVVVADTAGRVLYTGTGDCRVPVSSGTYIVKVGATAVKLLVN